MLLTLVCGHLYVSVCVYTCMCLRVHVHICCMYVWKTEVNIRYLPQLISALSYESGPHAEP